MKFNFERIRKWEKRKGKKRKIPMLVKICSDCNYRYVEMWVLRSPNEKRERKGENVNGREKCNNCNRLCVKNCVLWSANENKREKRENINFSEKCNNCNGICVKSAFCDPQLRKKEMKSSKYHT